MLKLRKGCATQRCKGLVRLSGVAFALPGVEFLATCARFGEGISWEDWRQAGQVTSGLFKVSLWWLGDWINFAEDHFVKPRDRNEEDSATRLKGALQSTGLGPDVLRQAAWVARKVDGARRRTELSWQHHREVTPFDGAEQDRWLELAIVNRWTVSELRQAIRRANKRVVDEPDIDIGFVPERAANEMLRGFRGEIERLGPISDWAPELRTSWKRIFKPIFDLYQQL